MKHFLLAVVAVLSFAAARAQTQPVFWKVSATPAGGGNYTLSFHAVLTPGWLLFSLHPGADNNLVAPSFKIDPATATVTGEPSEQGFASDLQLPGIDGLSRSYSTEALFNVPVKAAKGRTVKGSYTYQLRNREGSLPPKTVSFSVKLP